MNDSSTGLTASEFEMRSARRARNEVMKFQIQNRNTCMLNLSGILLPKLKLYIQNQDAYLLTQPKLSTRHQQFPCQLSHTSGAALCVLQDVS